LYRRPKPTPRCSAAEEEKEEVLNNLDVKLRVTSTTEVFKNIPLYTHTLPSAAQLFFQLLL
jgi:hypothetical protein